LDEVLEVLREDDCHAQDVAALVRPHFDRLDRGAVARRVTNQLILAR
jgi:hypothetical protein